MSLEEAISIFLNIVEAPNKVEQNYIEATQNYVNFLNSCLDIQELQAVAENWEIMLRLPFDIGVETYKHLIQIHNTPNNLRWFADYVEIHGLDFAGYSQQCAIFPLKPYWGFIDVDELILILTSYLKGDTSAEIFQDQFLKFRTLVLDEQDQATKSVPGLWEALLKLQGNDFLTRFRPREFERQFKKLHSQVPKTRIQPLGDEDIFLGDLFTPITQYESDLVVRASGYIDEIQLREEVVEVLRRYRPFLNQYGLSVD